MSKDIKQNKLSDELINEWHPTKNGDLKPDDVKSKSSKKVWWICSKGHEWKARIYSRTNGSNCSYCSNRKVLKGYNDLITTHPELVNEWHPTKNKDLTPGDVAARSHKKVWWICDKGHEWEATIANRSRGRSCPYCSNRRVLKGFNDLTTINPKLVKEWNLTKNKNLTPNDVTYGVNKKVWWICDKGHEWEATIANRSNGRNCPYCSNNKTLKGFNDLGTTHPELVKEWHPTKNKNLTPNDVTYGVNKKAWWVCNKGHEWEATVNNRSKGKGCPHCNKEKRTSFPELAIYFYIKKAFKDAVHSYKINNTEIDIYIPSLKMGIEYDGAYWHKDKLDIDINKNNKLTKDNITLLRVRENGLEEINTSNGYSYILNDKTKKSLDKSIKWIFNKLCTINNVTIDKNKAKAININTNKDEIEILNIIDYMTKKNSLAKSNPKLVKEWHPAKNKDLAPNDVTPNSGKKVWWKCSKGHEWESIIKNRTKGSKCPYCSNKKILKGFNDLKTTNPKLAKEWHPTKNSNLTPDSVSRGSGKKIWWKCSHCNEEYARRICDQVKSKKCPKCRLHIE